MKGKDIKEFILNNIVVKEVIVRPWKLSFKPVSREVIVVNRAFISTKWSNPDYCEKFIIECMQCEDDIIRPYGEDFLLQFIIEHAEEHLKNNIKKVNNKVLDDFI